jgi:hypothetical protein
MKFVSLVFDYDFKKQKSSGRIWADQAYRSKDFIFEYTAASIATFCHRNPKIKYIVDTDSVELLNSKLDQYLIDTSFLDIRDSTDLIRQWSKDDYCFWPLLRHLDYHASQSEESIVKLDNDLTCLKPIDDLLEFKGALAWKFERRVCDGRDYWGEKYACINALGTDQFSEYNTGVLGISKENLCITKEMLDTCEKLIDIDVSDVIRFPEAPGVKVKTYSTSDQTATNWVFHKNNLDVLETYDYFYHHCYGHDAKKDCITAAEFLRK